MRRYFLQIDDCGHAADEEGRVFVDEMALEAAVLRALFDVGRDDAIGGRARSTSITAKDDKGTAVFRATLSVESEWLGSSDG